MSHAGDFRKTKPNKPNFQTTEGRAAPPTSAFILARESLACQNTAFQIRGAI